MPKQSISIIGIGDDGLEAVSNAVRQLILGAEILAGKERTLALVPEATGKRLIVGTDLEAVVQEINAAGDAKVAVLVNGDPLFYGLARFLCDRLGNDRCDIIPHVSSMQLAFARVKENWDEAYLTNLANHKLETVIEKIRGATKVGLFTTDEISPAMVAKKLLARKINYFTVYVCENLGARNERVTRGTVAEIAEQEFQPLNVMVLVRDADIPDQPRKSKIRSKFGNADEEFVQSTPKHGLLTPAEVRAVALCTNGLAIRERGLGCGGGIWLGEYRSSPAFTCRAGVCHRAGQGRRSTHPRECRPLWGLECDARVGDGPRSVERLAQPGCGVYRGEWQGNRTAG